MVGGSIGGSRSHLGRLVQPGPRTLALALAAGAGSWVNSPSSSFSLTIGPDLHDINTFATFLEMSGEIQV